MDKDSRKAAKAGSWYESDPKILSDELTSYLNNADVRLPN